MRAIAIVLLLGCGGGSKQAAAPKPAASCEAAAAGMVAMMQDGRENVEEEAGAYRTMIARRCDDDRWSAEAKNCLSSMKTKDDAQVCATLLTDDQQGNLVRDQDARMKTAPQAEPPAPKKLMKSRNAGDPCDGGE